GGGCGVEGGELVGGGDRGRHREGDDGGGGGVLGGGGHRAVGDQHCVGALQVGVCGERRADEVGGGGAEGDVGGGDVVDRDGEIPAAVDGEGGDRGDLDVV